MGGGVQIGVGDQREIRKIRLALTPIYPLIVQELLTSDLTNRHQVISIAAQVEVCSLHSQRNMHSSI